MLFVYLLILCICILLTLLLWNHFYSNPRLRRPSHGGIAGRDGWIDDVWMARGMVNFSRSRISHLNFNILSGGGNLITKQ